MVSYAQLRPIENAEQALLERKVPAVLIGIAENERPLQGFAGRMDWKYAGVISYFLKKNIFSGKKGELVYFPHSHLGQVVSFFLLGVGKNPIGRRPFSKVFLGKTLKKKLFQAGFSVVWIEKKEWDFEHLS